MGSLHYEYEFIHSTMEHGAPILLSHVNLTTNILHMLINIISIMTQQAMYAYEYNNVYDVVAYLRRANKNYISIVLRTPTLSEQRF